MPNDEAALHVPAQIIPPPKSISPQGQAYLAALAKRIAVPASEAASGLSDAAAVQFLRPMAARFKGSVETIPLPHGAQLYRVTPDGRQGRFAELGYFDIHGGGFVTGNGEMCLLLAKIRAGDYGVEVFAVDYRLATEQPFPAALDDCVAAYREVLKRCPASSLIVAGASAGGNLAAALMLRARDEGMALPLALLLQTPALDMSRSGDSYTTNRYLDVNLHGATGGLDLYIAGQDVTNPYLSPLSGDFGKGWPPTMLTTGTRDLLLSDTVRMHRALRRAGVTAELHVSEAGPHGGFMGAQAPEDAEIIAECRRFLYAAWGVSSQ